MTREAILVLVLETVRGYHLALNPDVGETETSPDVVLLGPEGVLDSIGLVSVVIELEQKLSDASGRELSLMDDRAMSRARSPFRTPRTLAEYAYTRMSETTAAQ